jgi:UbiD family decarboxylase
VFNVPYKDLREYLSLLDRRGYLKRVKKEVDKEWEISCVMRQVLTKLPEEERYALIFENVKGHEIPVVVGALGVSNHVYAIGLETTPENILERWARALRNTVEPKTVENGPVKDNVIKGSKVDLNKFPIPTWTPGKDGGPFITAPYVVTKDPETGVRNVGTYRMQLKGRNKTGILIEPHQHIGMHCRKYEIMDKPMPVAVVIGTDPTIGMTSVAKVPYGVDEFAVAGGLRGEAVELVKCEMVDLEVPATAEIVLEGEVPPNVRELEGPFGEYTGYVGGAAERHVFNVSCITYRENPIYQAFINEMPPTESNKIIGIGLEALYYKHLVYDLKFPVKDVYIKEASGSQAYVVISFRSQYTGQSKQILASALGINPICGKIVVIVDDDIDIRNNFMLDWALSFRMQPDRDIIILPGTPPLPLDPSVAPNGAPPEPLCVVSRIGIDATKKWPYPDLSLPSRELMDKVRKRWSDYGLPPVK